MKCHNFVEMINETSLTVALRFPTHVSAFRAVIQSSPANGISIAVEQQGLGADAISIAVHSSVPESDALICDSRDNRTGIYGIDYRSPRFTIFG